MALDAWQAEGHRLRVLAAAPDAVDEAARRAIDEAAELLRVASGDRRTSTGPGASAPAPAAASRRLRPRVFAMVRLEALPLPAREEVVRFLPPARDEFMPGDRGVGALPFISRGTLAALQEQLLPIGTFRARTVEKAVQQANALRRA